MRKFLFIINPEAGGGRSAKLIDIIDEKMQKSGHTYKIIATKKPNEATDIARNNIDNFTDIIAVGGDGTVNEVARALIENKKGLLGIIPSGTGNDLSTSLGIPADVDKALELILAEDRELSDIDVCSINGRPYLNISTIGFDADVVKMTNNIKKVIKSGFSYIISVLINLLFFKKTRIELIIDGKSHDINSFLLAVGNGKYYGGGIPIMPSAKTNNGYLEVCSVKDASNLKILTLFPSIFKENHVKHTKYVTIYRAKEVIVNTPKEMILNIDGEIIDDNKERQIVFRIEEYKLPVIAKPIGSLESSHS